MAPVSFTVTNTTTVSNEVVVVSPFIADADQNASLAEWRVLAPGPNGGSAQFTYNGAIAASVSDGSASTAAVPVSLGQLLSVTSTQTGGLQLAPAGNGGTSKQSVVRNDSTDPNLLIVTWTVDGARVLTEGGVNQGASATLELTNTLLFHLRTVQAVQLSSGFRAMTVETGPVSYAIPPPTTSVAVTWSRNGAAGRDVFTFSPPSA